MSDSPLAGLAISDAELVITILHENKQLNAVLIILDALPTRTRQRLAAMLCERSIDEIDFTVDTSNHFGLGIFAYVLKYYDQTKPNSRRASRIIKLAIQMGTNNSIELLQQLLAVNDHLSSEHRKDNISRLFVRYRGNQYETLRQFAAKYLEGSQLTDRLSTIARQEHQYREWRADEDRINSPG